MSIRDIRFLLHALLALIALGAMASDQYVWVGITGVLTLVAFFLYPRVGAACTFVVTLVSDTLQAATGIVATLYLDDVLIFVCVVTFSARRLYSLNSIRWMPALIFFLLYLALGLVSSVARDVPLSTSALTGFLFVKGALLAFAVAQIDWIRDDLPKVIGFGGWLLVVMLAAAFLNALAPGPWSEALGATPGGDRVGFPSLTGIFDHPVGLGTSMSLSFVAVYLYQRLVRRTPLTVALLVGSALANAFSFRRKSIVSMIAASILGRLSLRGGRSVVLAVILVATPLALLLMWDPLVSLVSYTWSEYFTNPDRTARTLMTRDSVLIALGYFPLGAGLGRYGSHPARQDYSPEYVDRGYQFIYGMGPAEEGMFLTDTFWPAVLGEAGLLGFACYAAGTILLAHPAWRLMRKGTHPHVRWIGAVGTAWLAGLLIESWVAPVFSSPPMYGLFPAVAGICYALALSEFGAPGRSAEESGASATYPRSSGAGGG